MGWPPIRASRISTLVNQAKPQSGEEVKVDSGKNKSKHTEAGTLDGVCEKNKANQESRNSRSSLFVKVNMDGVPIGRKVNLSAHRSYETLAQTLENMFLDPTALVDSSGNLSDLSDLMYRSEFCFQSLKLNITSECPLKLNIIMLMLSSALNGIKFCDGQSFA